MTGLALAKARAKLLAELRGGTSGRLAARRAGGELIGKINDPDYAQMVRISGDQSLKDQINLQAAAILNSNDIAASVSGPDRAALAGVIDQETRTRALNARALAKPATGATGEACAANISASIPDIEAAWAHISPFLETPDDASPDLAYMTAATEMAISQLDDHNG